MDANGAIGGVVRMNTIGVNDILFPEKNIGVRLKGSFNSNSSSAPVLGSPGGTPVSGSHLNTAVPAEYGSQEGMNRPAFLSPTGGSGSLATVTGNVDFEIVGAYARRRRSIQHISRQ